MEIGADPDALDATAAALRDESRRLRSSGRAIDGGLRAAAWTGSDARDFAGLWAAHHEALRRAADALDGAARRLASQADQQRQASESGSPEGTGSSSSRDGGGIPAAAAAEVERVRELLGPLPSRLITTQFDIGLGVLLAQIEGSQGYTVADLPGPLSTVTSYASGGAGVGVGAGAAASIDGGGSLPGPAGGGGATASAAALLAGVQSMSWTVDDDDVDDLLPRVTASPISQLPLVDAEPSLRSLPLVGGIAARAFDHLHAITGRPAPDVVSAGVGRRISLDAGAAASPMAMTGSRVDAAAELEAVIGRRQRGDDAGWLLSANGSASASAALDVLGLDGYDEGLTGAASAEIEVLPAEGDLRSLVITTSTEADGDVRLDRTVVVLDERRAGESIEGVRDALMDGDPRRAAMEAAGIEDVVVARHRDSASGTVEVDDGPGIDLDGGSVGIKGSIDVGVRSSVTELRPRRR
jgi:uncharacterized protein YukE